VNTSDDVAALGTILGVWAHPDDEAYLSGGLMALARDNGQRVVCVTATRGERGTPDPVAWPPDRLAEERTRELARCLSILGVEEHHWLGYRDGGCAGADRDPAVARLAAVLGDVRPDTVLTFGPDGMTGHDDHRAACRWATEAFARVGKPGAVLAYATHTPDWVERFEPALESVGAYMDDTRTPVTPVDELAYAVQLEGDLLETKLRAIRSMTSQIEPLVAALGESFFRAGMVEEAFRLP